MGRCAFEGTLSKGGDPYGSPPPRENPGRHPHPSPEIRTPQGIRNSPGTKRAGTLFYLSPQTEAINNAIQKVRTDFKDLCAPSFLFTKEQQSKESAEGVLVQIALIQKVILTHTFRNEPGTNDPNEESTVELLKVIVQQLHKAMCGE